MNSRYREYWLKGQWVGRIKKIGTKVEYIRGASPERQHSVSSSRHDTSTNRSAAACPTRYKEQHVPTRATDDASSIRIIVGHGGIVEQRGKGGQTTARLRSTDGRNVESLCLGKSMKCKRRIIMEFSIFLFI